ncbi:hypothetical protein ABVK25_002702 [Lepraria finkii]|uniref:Expansin-like EG45 domain-containing protein n=1 Tax=Lepraria finkii TaxID=1340010 RepID=A0ABR4BLX5_9LECA
MHCSLSLAILSLLTSPLPTLTTASYPVLTSSFTWNQNCGPSVACGPSAAGTYGTGYAAANNVTYASGAPIINGVGAGCGQCWHLQPLVDQFSSDGLRFGTPVVVKINDQCTDAGYCDQEEGSNNANVNTRYGKQVHFDLCNATGVTNQFFGQIAAGVVMGLAQRLDDCSALDDGPFGSKLGTLGASGVKVVLDASGTPNVGGAFQIATSAASSSATTSSGPVTGTVPLSSGSVVPASGADSTKEDVVDEDDDDDDDYCEEL